MVEVIEASSKAGCEQVSGLVREHVEWMWESFGEDGGHHFRLLLRREGVAVAAVEDEHLTLHPAEGAKFCLLDSVHHNM